MFRHIERHNLPYAPRQMFDLVADVESIRSSSTGSSRREFAVTTGTCNTSTKWCATLAYG